MYEVRTEHFWVALWVFWVCSVLGTILSVVIWDRLGRIEPFGPLLACWIATGGIALVWFAARRWLKS